MFDFANKRKMPILADLSRRLRLLTTDAKPDPPRIPSKDNTNNLLPSPSDSNQKSQPTTPDVKDSREAPKNPLDPRGSNSDANSEDEGDRPGLGNDRSASGGKKEWKDSKNARFKTKIPYKAAQTANVVNYNIINSNGVKIGATRTYVCNVNQCTKNSKESCGTSSTKGKLKTMPKTVEDLSTCEQEITVDDMFVIKTHVGHGWRDVVRRLGYSEGQLDQFEENYKEKGIDEVIYQALLDWKQANTKKAQIGVLTRTLWSCREYDCAERLAAAAAAVQQTPP
ncbi:protein immune deficiency [Venturia canescens]|uniref:protein immune deficiency n=1 Tax=Venturia canescens TaxID=32260 RepID=UPI001C9C2D9E|nr:protein immune deficiency [Venturia canescens]